LGELGQVVTGSDQRQLGPRSKPKLPETDGRGEIVADALAAVCLFRRPAFGKEIPQRLSRTAVADRTIGLAVGVAEVTEVAYPGTVLVKRSFEQRLLPQCPANPVQFSACKGKDLF
jgi:hypothetical protein